MRSVRRFGRLFIILSGLISLCHVSTTQAFAATYFVATSGIDSNSCSQAQNRATPKRTITAALACVGGAGSVAGAGHTVEVAAGSYSESLVDKIPSGSDSANLFTLKCASDFACTNSLSTASPAPAQIGFNAATQWVRIRGFIFDGGGGLYLSAYSSNPHHDIFIEYNEIRNSPNGMGIQASSSSRITVTGNKIHDVGSICTGAGPGYCHGIYAADYTQDWVIQQNEIYNVIGYGIHLYGSTALPSGFVINRNKLHHNGKSGVNGAGIIAYGANHVIANNLSYQNVYEGILLRAVTNPLIYNNTTYGNGAAGISKESGSGAVCKNNLTIADGAGGISACDVVANNIVTGTPASHFVDVTTSNFALKATSSAIKAGVDLSPTVVTDFAGTVRPASAYDVGAYQYISSSSTPPSAPTNLRVVP